MSFLIHVEKFLFKPSDARNAVIALGVIYVVLWFTTDFAYDLGRLIDDHGGAIILWGIAWAIIFGG